MHHPLDRADRGGCDRVPEGERCGRASTDCLERMLRIYFLQLWFNLSDPAAKEALYDSVSMRGFVGIDLGMEAAPDETTVCKFRHLRSCAA